MTTSSRFDRPAAGAQSPAKAAMEFVRGLAACLRPGAPLDERALSERYAASFGDRHLAHNARIQQDERDQARRDQARRKP